jgi:hypothetical protein
MPLQVGTVAIGNDVRTGRLAAGQRDRQHE